MVKMQIIGCGAAGNKAVIDLIEKEYINRDKFDYLLINSTSKDIPVDYREKSMIFGQNQLGGCGKERTKGKRMLLEDTENGIRAIEDKINPDTELVVVCGSTEGGTGSAAIPIVSKYVKSVLKIPTIAVLFFGFNDDARGMQNSIEICQELSEDIGVISICNSAFMESANGSKIRAEKMANIYFACIMREISGVGIYESSQNIDDTDLRKVLFTAGYIRIESILLKNIKNIEQFNKRVNDAIDNDSASIDSPTKSAKRIACIFNVKSNADYVDYSCNVFKNRFGMPYELFTHIQDSLESAEYITVIASGMDLPIDFVKDIYNQYKKTSSIIKKDRDNFFDEMNTLHGNSEDAMFNMFDNIEDKSSIDKDRESFFKEFEIDLKPQMKPNKKDNSEEY